MAEPSRPRVDEHGHLVTPQPERLGGRCVEDLCDALHLEEVVARSQRAELVGAALAGAVGHRPRVRVREAALRLGVLDVAGTSDAVLGQQDARSADEHSIQRVVGESQRAAMAGPDGNASRDLVHQALRAVAQLGGAPAGGRAVDVVAHAAR
jgi:hypothetical protein